MEMIYANEFTIGQIVYVDPSIQSSYSEAIPFEYGLIAYNENCRKKIIVGLKNNEHDCFMETSCLGEPLIINGIAKIRFYTGTLDSDSYNSDYVEKSVSINNGILQLSTTELDHFITILQIDQNFKVNHKNKKKLVVLDESQLYENNLIQLNINDLIIDDITLLSIEEVEWMPEKYRVFNNWWWLRSPGSDQNHATCVINDGSVFPYGGSIRSNYVLVRPALIVYNLKSFSLPLQSEVALDGRTKWLVISDNMLLCNDESFGKHRFDSESNNYDTSEIKRYIYEKAKKLGLFVDKVNKVNHKNKKKLVVLDESRLNEDLTELKTSDLYIDDITLLSTEQAARIPQQYREFYRWWWLSTPHTDKYYVQVVDDDGIMPRIASIDYKSENCVRPALIVLNLNYFDLPLYSKVILDNGTEWIVISDNILLCDDTSFCESIFDTKSNNYETSEIKQYIHEKAKELGFKNIGGARNVNHKNKKKLVVLDENIINKNMDIWYNNDFNESYGVEENYTIADDFDYNYIKLK